MRLALDDGYTLQDKTQAEFKVGDIVYTDLPVVEFFYRPALPDAINSWQYATTHANSGPERVTATARIVADHLTRWDVQSRGATAPIDIDHVRRIPIPILEQLLTSVMTWKPKREEAAGNSQAASA